MEQCPLLFSINHPMQLLQIYEALRELTYLKAQLLQSVLTSCSSPSPSSTTTANPIINDISTQKNNGITTNKLEQQSTEQQSYENVCTAYLVLRNQCKQLQQIKMSKLAQRIQVLIKRKQLQTKLQQHNYLTQCPYIHKTCPTPKTTATTTNHLIESQSKTKTRSQTQTQTQNMEITNKLQEQFIKLKKYRQAKQQQLTETDQQVAYLQQNIDQLFIAHEQLQNQIVQCQSHCNNFRKQLANQQHRYQQLTIRKSKLSKQLLQYTPNMQPTLRLIPWINGRSLQNKVNNQVAVHGQISALCRNRIDCLDRYEREIQNIRNNLIVQDSS